MSDGATTATGGHDQDKRMRRPNDATQRCTVWCDSARAGRCWRLHIDAGARMLMLVRIAGDCWSMLAPDSWSMLASLTVPAAGPAATWPWTHSRAAPPARSPVPPEPPAAIVPARPLQVPTSVRAPSGHRAPGTGQRPPERCPNGARFFPVKVSYTVPGARTVKRCPYVPGARTVPGRT